MMAAAYLKAPAPAETPKRVDYWCEGKERFESGLIAADVAQRSKAKGPRIAYYCRTCGFFHVGTNKSRRMANGSVAARAELIRTR